MKRPARIVAVAAVLVAGLLGPALARQTDETAIRARVKEYVSAYNRGDASGVAAVYAPEGTHTYVMGLTHRGRVEIEKGLQEMLAGPLKGTQIAITPEKIRILGDGIAVEEATFVMSGLKTPAGLQADPVKGLCLGVYQKQGQRWFAAAVQCMVPPPAGTTR
jgi:uncharacterized protein (TIGR02246 family)